MFPIISHTRLCFCLDNIIIIVFYKSRPLSSSQIKHKISEGKPNCSRPSGSKKRLVFFFSVLRVDEISCK